MIKKLLAIFTALLLCLLSAQAQLLWRVEGKNLKQPSYVLGTYHFASATFADSVPGLKAAMQATGQVYGELNMADEDSPAAMQQMMAAMMLPQGQKLDKLLTADQLKRLNAYLSSTLGGELSDSMLLPLNQMTPAAVMIQLQAMLVMQLEPGFDTSNQFDGYFQRVAREQGKPTGGLETMEHQINMLFKQPTMARQIEQLMCLVDQIDYNRDMVRRMSQAFHAQDLEALYKLVTEKQHNTCDMTPAEEDALINQRNADWATKLPAIMESKPTLVAVGAGHLPGDRGLLNLLRQQGYTVTAVK